MDKKKVKELVGKAKDYILAYQKSKKDSDLAMAFLNMQSAERELSKSDWVSVEDGLPEYGEKVLVCNAKKPDVVMPDFRSNAHDYIVNDDYGFLIDNHVTHWRRIDKLEE